MMRAIVSWACRNSPAVNVLLVSLLIIGAMALSMMRREVFPEFQLEIVLVTVPYPGASPAEVEDGICQKIEEATRSLAGIKKMTSVAVEGAGNVVLEIDPSVKDVQKIVNEVRSEVERIPSFPDLAERPEVTQITLREPALFLGIMGPNDDSPAARLRLRDVAESIRQDVLQLPDVSQANLMGVPDYQIDVEISEQTLRKHGLSLRDVAAIVRRENLELPGGTMKTNADEVLLRAKNKQIEGRQIAKLPLVTQPNGSVLTVGDLGTVRDEFLDSTFISRINGRPAIALSVDRTADEDLLRIADEVKEYVERTKAPEGFELVVWADRSADVRERMNMLFENGLQGGALVFILLALFLEFRLAWWVAFGIPISLFGAAASLYFLDQTLNMLTLFAFLLAEGIVVDDAIVVGENVYAHAERGKNPHDAAVDGTLEVVPSVFASVCTTMIAFAPLMYVSGVMGKFIGVMPVTVIVMLLFSLGEALTSLPCHLAHNDDNWLVGARVGIKRMPSMLRWTIGWVMLAVVDVLLLAWWLLQPIIWTFAWLSQYTTAGLRGFINYVYDPAIRFALWNPATVVAGSVAMVLFSLGLIAAGVTPFEVFPKLDSNTIEAKIVFPNGAPASVADDATRRIEEAFLEVAKKYDRPDHKLVQLTYRTVGSVKGLGPMGPGARTSGSHVGSVSIEMAPAEEREADSDTLISEWRMKCGEFAGAELLRFGTPQIGPGGTPIEFKLLADSRDMASLEEAVEKVKAALADEPGVYDVADDSSPGKWEFQLKIKDNARQLGVQLQDLADAVRGAYYGEEVMRLQRGRHEVKLMVRFPLEDRRSLAEFNEIRVRTADGAERPLTELAEVTVVRGYSEINRVDQLRSITVSADVDTALGNAYASVQKLQREVMPKLLENHPGVRVRWEGQQEQTDESLGSLKLGFLMSILAMYALLVMQFESYFQPLIVLATIPFGIVGAIWGHAALGMSLTMFSFFGIVALSGVVVTDSIVLMDFINERLKSGEPIRKVLIDSGRQRFRAVFLTSAATIGGLLPILFEESFQAQVLIPMAVSLACGLMTTMVLVLVLTPTLYYIYYATLVEPLSPTDPHGPASSSDDGGSEPVQPLSPPPGEPQHALAGVP